MCKGKETRKSQHNVKEGRQDKTKGKVTEDEAGGVR